MKKKRIIIIPVRNADKNIAKIITDIKMEMPSAHYVIIDDGSTDNTVSICKEKSFNIIELRNSNGLDAALETGYNFAVMHDYDYVIRFDGSGSYNPKDITKLESGIEEKFDIIIGRRTDENGIGNMGSILLSTFIFWLTNKKIQDVNSGLSIISNKVAKNLLKVKGKKVTASFICEQIKEGYTIKEEKISFKKTNNKFFKEDGGFSALSAIKLHVLFRPFLKRFKKGE